MKICLVVDDSSVIRKVARRILEGMDFQIVEAEDGEQALGACQRQLPDAVLLDREACWGCGTCRAGCHRKALTLESRSATADVAMRW